MQKSKLDLNNSQRIGHFYIQLFKSLRRRREGFCNQYNYLFFSNEGDKQRIALFPE